MPLIETEGMKHDDVYKLLVGSVVPRPIAWLTTIDPENGRVNAAPFSCYTFCCSSPPMVGVTVGRGRVKDSTRNSRNEGSFVLNVVSEDLIEPMHLSSTDFPPDVSEPEHFNIELAPSKFIRPPRVKAAPIALECKVNQILALGDKDGSDFIIGQVIAFHINDDLYENGKINMKKLKPLARLGGPVYARLGEYITMPSVGPSTTAR